MYLFNFLRIWFEFQFVYKLVKLIPKYKWAKSLRFDRFAFAGHLKQKALTAAAEFSRDVDGPRLATE